MITAESVANVEELLKDAERNSDSWVPVDPIDLKSILAERKRYVAALEELKNMAHEHPAFDESLGTVEELGYKGGDTCDWGIVHLIAKQALAGGEL